MGACASGADEARLGASCQTTKNGKTKTVKRDLRTMTIGSKKKSPQQSDMRDLASPPDSGGMMGDNGKPALTRPRPLTIIDNMPRGLQSSGPCSPSKIRGEHLKSTTPCFGRSELERTKRTNSRNIKKTTPTLEGEETESFATESVRSERRSALCTSINLLDNVYHNYEEALLDQCKKCKININLKVCFEIICMNKGALRLSEAKDPYTGATCLHYCSILGHRELLQKIVEIEPSLATAEDQDGNTPLHYLCLNSVSKYSEMKRMWKSLKRAGADEHATNSEGKTCIQLLKDRLKLSNPYDDLAKWNKLIEKSMVLSYQADV
ncbi:unnamed protein product [Moneuplotes crassus]|uniref:ANK_REP_REGION domain-containing protein n=1 Tax=Euplotes crassus TaxID=5936 RepID=A0AAD2DBF7_EUPCR|nr:unnamed protein product [Moneuplotes crassus]